MNTDADEISAMDNELRFLLGGHACTLPQDTRAALAQLHWTIGKVLEEAPPAGGIKAGP